jgi:hypothetical protein
MHDGVASFPFCLSHFLAGSAGKRSASHQFLTAKTASLYYSYVCTNFEITVMRKSSTMSGGDGA